jgi:hypothetical protein
MVEGFPFSYVTLSFSALTKNTRLAYYRSRTNYWRDFPLFVREKKRQTLVFIRYHGKRL